MIKNFRLAYLLLLLSPGFLSADSHDNVCQQSESGSADLNGCGFGDIIQLPGVDFATGSAQLTTRAAGILDRLVMTIKENQGLVFEVAGHTDNVGSETNNRRLSQRRAASVMTYLVLKGVESERLSAQGYGESSPIADNKTGDGRKRNRRVELRVVATPK
ncbi:MAG: OmpA family protein [Pseudomonadota bacterium]